jgi:single-stranded DNA-binding protein
MSSTLVVIEGQLHGTPETKYTSTQKQITNFQVSVPNGYGQNAKAPSVFKLSAWEEVAAQVAGLAPDTKFTIYGRLVARTYDWQGQTKIATDIVADAVIVRKTYNSGQRGGLGNPARPQNQVDEEMIPF